MGISIDIANILFLPSEFFSKMEHLCSFLVVSYGFSATNTYSSTISYSSIKGIRWCSKKKLSEFSEESVYECFEKATAPKVSVYFLAKHPGWSPF